MDERSPHDTLAQHRDSHRAMQNLIDHVKVLSADARELLRQSAGQTGEQLARLREKTAQSLSALDSRLAPLQHAITERGRVVVQASTRHVRQHPFSTLAAAGALVLAIAAVLAWQSEARRDDDMGDS